MMGYGYASPANFRKSAELENIKGDIYNGHDGGSPVMVYEYGNNNHDIKVSPLSKKTPVVRREKKSPAQTNQIAISPKE